MEVPLNGLQEGSCNDGTPYGKSCNFFCDKGFALVGAPILTCIGDDGSIIGEWNDLMPNCQGKIKNVLCPEWYMYIRISSSCTNEFLMVTPVSTPWGQASNTSFKHDDLGKG